MSSYSINVRGGDSSESRQKISDPVDQSGKSRRESSTFVPVNLFVKTFYVGTTKVVSLQR